MSPKYKFDPEVEGGVKEISLNTEKDKLFLAKISSGYISKLRSVGGFLGAKCTTWWSFSLFLCCFLQKMYLIVVYWIGSSIK